MKLLFETLPIIFFVAALIIFDIYVATAALIAITTLQVLVYYIKYRKVDKMLLTTFIVVLVFGGMTILLKNEMFIKWKPTVIYWLFALGFFLSQYIGGKPFIQRMLEKNFQPPSAMWYKLNMSWVIFFIIMGIINTVVLYTVSTETWAMFKVAYIGLTLAFTVLQCIYLAPHMHEQDQLQDKEKSSVNPQIKEQLK